MVGNDGTVYAFGEAKTSATPPCAGGAQAVDLEPTPSGNGYWIVDDPATSSPTATPAPRRRQPVDPQAGRDDHQPVGDARAATATGSSPTGAGPSPSATPSTYGDMSRHASSTGRCSTRSPPRRARATTWSASDGGIFTFGDADFDGSMGGKPLNAPVQSLVPDGDGDGYWLVASDGGIFAFDAPFRGSMGGQQAQQAGDRHGPLRQRLPDGRRGRRHLQLLRQAVRRLAGRQPARPADHLGGGPRRPDGAVVQRAPQQSRSGVGTRAHAGIASAAGSATMAVCLVSLPASPGRRDRLPAALRQGAHRVPPGADRDAARRSGRDGHRRPRPGRRSRRPGPRRAGRAALARPDPVLSRPARLERGGRRRARRSSSSEARRSVGWARPSLGSDPSSVVGRRRSPRPGAAAEGA